MFKHHKFSESSKMIDLINENHSLLLVISRFGFSLGFGNQTVKEVCIANEIDCNTFLMVVNFLTEGTFEIDWDNEDISIVALINYLKNAHNYFHEIKFPSIRKKLIDAVNNNNQNLAYGSIFLRFFDEYVAEVKKHTEYENKVVFRYAIKLLNGETDLHYTISVFKNRHNEIDSKLSELKNILIKYYPAQSNSHLLTEVLFDIFSCEQDLTTHNQVEDYLFIPTVEALEQRNNVKG